MTLVLYHNLEVLKYIFFIQGSDYGPNVRRWKDGSRPANLGQCFVAINPECFAPGFELRMCDLMCTLRNLKPVSILCAPNTVVLFTFFLWLVTELRNHKTRVNNLVPLLSKLPFLSQLHLLSDQLNIWQLNAWLLIQIFVLKVKFSISNLRLLILWNHKIKTFNDFRCLLDIRLGMSKRLHNYHFVFKFKWDIIL